MDDAFVEKWISSLPVIPASRSATPDSEKEQTTPDTFGRILSESLRQLDLFGSSGKTLADTLPSDSPKFIEAYEIWVIQLRQDCLRRQRSVRLTDGNGCLSWPTTTNRDWKGKREGNRRGFGADLNDAVSWPTPQQRDCTRETSVKRDRLPDRVGLLDQDSPNTNGKSRGLWPTVKVTDTIGGLLPAIQTSTGFRNPRGYGSKLKEAVAEMEGGLLDQDSPSTNGKSRGPLWRTPQGQEPGIKRERLKGENGHRMYDKETGRLAQYALTQQVKGRLNPKWVEQLMGLLVGWTDCGCSEMGSSRSKRKRHLDI